MIGILLGVVRVLIIILIVRIVLRWFAERRVVRPRRPVRSGRERIGGQLVRDPQCGTYVAENLAVKSDGQSFCSAKCRDEWIEAQGQTARVKASR